MDKIIDIAKIEEATRLLLEGLGEDPTREGLRETPQRVARAWAEMLGRRDFTPTSFEDACDDMVLVRDIPFFSFCEHHLLPFLGTAHIAYVPNGRVLGLSKVVRIFDAFARGLQIQERLGEQVVDELTRLTEAKGAAVIIEAEHTCMTLRGVMRPGAKTVTSAVRGIFRDTPAARAELMALCLHR